MSSPVPVPTAPPAPPGSAGARPAPPVERDLVRLPLAAVAALVRRFPAAIIATALVLAGTFVVLAGQAEEAGQGGGMLPDLPAVNAATAIADRFGTANETVVQILVRGDGTLAGADGLAAADALEAAIRDSDAAAHLADHPERPGVITWMFPVQHTLAAEDGASAATSLDDGEVAARYVDALDRLPAEHAGLAAGLLPDDAELSTVDRALVFVFLDTDGLSADWDERSEQLLEMQLPLADAVSDAQLPAGIDAVAISEALLFADDDVFTAEIARLFGGAFLIIVIILAFVYWVRPQAGMSRTRSGRRSAADVLMSMAGISMAIVLMSGAATLLGPGYLGVIGGMTEFTQIIPILLIGLGVDYAIHVTSRYREELGGGARVATAMGGSITAVGGALVLATATTALGFLTNVVNPIPTLRDFGVLAAVGIVASFVVMLTVVPAARLLLDRRAEEAGRLPAQALSHSAERLLPKLMERTAVLAERAPVPTLVVTLALAGLGVVGLTQLETRFSTTDFVPDDSPALEVLDELAERFDGGYGELTDVLVTGDVATSDVHNALVDAHAALAATDDVVVHGAQPAARSIVTVLASLVAPGPDGAPAAPQVAEVAADIGLADDLTVPPGADVAALYLAVQEAAPDLADQLIAMDGDGSFDATVVRIQTTANDVRAAQLMDGLDGAFAPVARAGAEVVATSDPIMNETVITALQDSQVSSLVVTLLVAMLLLAAVFAYEQRRPMLGVITIVPVVLVVLWTFGMMAATDIPFGPITATIAALAIGIGLPYAIHVTHRFTEDRARHADAGSAIRSTVRHTGGAMAGSAFTTMTGFGILVTSSLTPFRQLGAVTVYAVGFSLLAATLVLPSLLVLWDRWHRRRQPGASSGPVGEVERDVALTSA